MSKLSIAMISEHASPLAALGGADAGGQNVHVAQLAAALVRRGHEVRVYTRRDAEHLPETVATPQGFSVEHVPAGPPAALAKDDLLPYMGQFGAWLDARWAAGGFRPDVVHAHFWMSGLAAIAARARPLVVTYHALGTVKRRMQRRADPSHPARVVLERVIGHAADRVIAQCADEISELAAYELTGDQVVHVPSGVDTEHFAPPRRGPLPRSAGTPPRIVTVGRFVPRKGFGDVIRILPHLPGAQLLIAGGPDRAYLDRDAHAGELRELAARLGVADRVQLLGAVAQSRMPALYRSAHALVCAPRYEPFGLTPLEAMACGTPVVAYAVGGLADSVHDGVTGTLVPPGDVAALGGAVRDLLADEPTRLAYAAASISRARHHYTWDRVAGEVERAYVAAISANRARRTVPAEPTRP